MKSNLSALALNDASSKEISPRNKCHLYLTFNSKEIDAKTANQFETNLGCKLDPWGTEVAKSDFINSWDVNATINEFISGIDRQKWEFFNDMISQFGGDLLLSVEIWFHRPPVFTLKKELLNKAIEYNFVMDFDLYPIEN